MFLDEDAKRKHPYMKTTCCIITCLTALAFNAALSQQPVAPVPGPGLQPQPGTPAAADFSSRVQNIIGRAGGVPSPEPTLTKFNLDFPGGTPKDLVAAIQKALRQPLNAIIPDDLAATKLPAVKMNSVDVSELFKALTAASHKTETVLGAYSGLPGYSYAQTACGFRQGSEGRLSDDTIWYFYVEKPNPLPPYSPAKVCRFYTLAPYLDRGATVDDITTAMETGWKMLGETSPPTISFHKDTKLLIAVGEPSKLEIIDAVLKALAPPMGGVAPPMGGGGSIPLGTTAPPTPRTNAPAPVAK